MKVVTGRYRIAYRAMRTHGAMAVCLFYGAGVVTEQENRR